MAVPNENFKGETRQAQSKLKISVPGIVACEKCGEAKLAHRVCKSAVTTAAARFYRLKKTNQSSNTKRKIEKEKHKHQAPERVLLIM